MQHSNQRRLGFALITVGLVALLRAAEGTPQPEAIPPGPAAAAATNLDSPARGVVIPIRDFFKQPFINLPKVNRKGTWLISTLDMGDDHAGAMFLNLATGNVQTIRGPSDRDIDEVHWLDDRRVLMSQSHEKLYADALFVTDVENLRNNYAVERYNAVRLVGVPLRSPLKPILWIVQDAYHDGDDGGAVQIDASRTIDQSVGRNEPNALLTMQIDVADSSGTAARIIRNYPELPVRSITTGYHADREGELAFAQAMEAGVETLFFLQKKKWVKSPLDLDRYEVVGAGDAADEVLAVGPRQEGKPRALLRVNAVTGEVLATLYQDEQYDAFVYGIYRHPVTHLLTGIQIYRKKLEAVWFDQAHTDLQARLNKFFPGKAVSMIGSDMEENKIVVAVYSDRQPVAYSLVDLTKNDAQGIAGTRPWISPKQMRPMQDLRYKARDGSKVEGYLTLPEGATKDNPPPLVVLAHGGPWARDSWGWDPEVQFLASRGYAVFQPNYRGSTGYSWSFPAGDDWSYRKMHEDVTDGVKQLIKTGLIDPQRVAIMGASFGGYLAMCGAAFEPELYRCAITEAGLFDLSLMMKEVRRKQFQSIRYQYFLRNLGDPEKQKSLFDEISPINHIAQVKIPVLVAHGKDDNVVDAEQSARLAKELQRFKVPHRLLLKRGEGHGMSRLENMVEYYTAVEAFLAENLRKR